MTHFFKRLTTSVLMALVVGSSFFSIGLSLANAQNETPNIEVTFFSRETCAHCKEAKVFFDDTEGKYPINLQILDLDTPKNFTKYEQIIEQNNLSQTTPLFVINNLILQGFDKAETTGKVFDTLFTQSYDAYYTLDQILVQNIELVPYHEKWEVCDEIEGCDIEIENPLYTVRMPFIGVINLQDYTLEALSLVLGFIDGFNPCAMWVLIMFLMALLKVGSRKKMFQMAGIFILAEAIMYFFILNVWMTTFHFLKWYNIVTPIVGLIGIGGGIFFLYEFWTYDGTCKVMNLKQQRSMSQKIQAFALKNMTFMTFMGVLGLAFSVNIIEFVCSIGIPQAFTQILEINDVSYWSKQWYMFLYIVMYMVDDLVVFGLALYGADKLHLTTKYAKYVNLIGGFFMVLLGALLIFAPEMLTF